MNTVHKLPICAVLAAISTQSLAYDIVDTGLVLKIDRIALNNDSIVYLQQDAVKTDIRTYNLISGAGEVVVSDEDSKFTLDTNNQGDIAWYQETFDPVTGARLSTIKSYKKTTNVVTEVYSDDVYLAEPPKPQLNEVGDVTWSIITQDPIGFPSGLTGASVYQYSAAASTTNQVTASAYLGGVPVFDVRPSLNDAGNTVWVAQSQYDSFSNVYFHEASTGTISMVSNGSTIEAYDRPKLNNVNQMVWQMQSFSPAGVECALEWSAGPDLGLELIEFMAQCPQLQYDILENGAVVYMKTDATGATPSQLRLYNPADLSNIVMATGVSAYASNKNGDLAWAADGVLSIRSGDTGAIEVLPAAGAEFILMNDNGDIIWKAAAAPGTIMLAKNTGASISPPLSESSELTLSVDDVKVKRRDTLTSVKIELAYTLNSGSVGVNEGDNIVIRVSGTTVLDTTISLRCGVFEDKNDFGKFELNANKSSLEMKLRITDNAVIPDSGLLPVSVTIGGAARTVVIPTL